MTRTIIILEAPNDGQTIFYCNGCGTYRTLLPFLKTKPNYQAVFEFLNENMRILTDEESSLHRLDVIEHFFVVSFYFSSDSCFLQYLTEFDETRFEELQKILEK